MLSGRNHDMSVICRLKVYLPYVLSAAAVLVFATYLWRNIDRYRELFDFTFVTVASLAGLALCFSVLNGSTNYVFYRALGVFLGFNESVGLAAVNTLANQLPFSAGLVTKGVYLKRRHQLAYTEFFSSTMALYVCFVGVNGAIGLAIVMAGALSVGVDIPPPLALGFFAMAASVVILWVPIDAISLPGAVGRRLTQLAEGWSVLSQNASLVGVMAGLQLMGTLLFALRLWIAFHALSQDVSYTQCLLFSSATVLTRLVSIMPGGLGVREGIVAGVAALLGFDPGISAIAVGLDRLVATSVIVVMGTVYTYVLSKKAVVVDADPDQSVGG